MAKKEIVRGICPARMLVVTTEAGDGAYFRQGASVDWMNLLMDHNPSAVRLPPSESAILSEVQP